MGTCAKLSGVLRLPPEHILFGRSEAMAVLRVQLQRVAANHLPVLIHGESGTGKEILVRLIHAWSPWGSGPLLKVNCSALGAGLADELFGPDRRRHRRCLRGRLDRNPNRTARHFVPGRSHGNRPCAAGQADLRAAGGASLPDRFRR